MSSPLFSPVFGVYNRAVTDQDRKTEVTKYISNADNTEISAQQYAKLTPDEQEYDYGVLVTGRVTDAARLKYEHEDAIRNKIQAVPGSQPGKLNLAKVADDRYQLEGVARPRNNAAMTHTMGDYLGPAFKQFQAEQLIDANFWEWVEQELATDISAANAAKRWNPNLFQKTDPRYHSSFIQWFRKGVKYLEETNARDRYKVEFRGDKIYHKLRSTDKDLSPLNKAEVVKHFTDKGRPGGSLIWVLGTANFYSHMSKIGRVHHSSFFAGGELTAAGEWDVENGKLKWISGQSGHYRPGLEFLADAVKALPNAVLTGASVRLFRGTTAVDMAPDEFVAKSATKQIPPDLSAFSST